jgi:hypothetical protein
MNVYYSNHLIRQEKVRCILHLSFIYPGSGMTRKAGSGIRIQDKHPGSATLGRISLKSLLCYFYLQFPSETRGLFFPYGRISLKS